ncbi:MAG: HD domain-containing protein [Clostridiales bacterium]|jgi:3'-5' exoribonuclease|nr:HD domain-containing protein [Clostridiales bacterium]
MRYIEDLKSGETIVCHYLCKKKESLKTKSGKNYLSLVLADRTGEILGRVWTLNKDIQSFESGDFIKIDATVDSYLDELQLNIRKIRKSGEGEYLPADYIPTTEKDVNEIYRAVCAYVASMQNEHLKKLLNAIFVQNDEVKAAFLSRSAARSMHHSYMGGLCEHTLNVAQICDFLAPRYKFVNRDLLVTAALLHDIGKIYELSEFPENDYTDCGRLLGHITMGVNLVTAEIAKIQGFPANLQNLLLHCLLSHHGKLEFGSPILPKTIEAFILSQADETDAHIKMFEEHLTKAPPTADWTGFNRKFGREIRRSNL